MTLVEVLVVVAVIGLAGVGIVALLDRDERAVLERETRRLLEFCGLDWQDACLEFHLNPAPVATASAVQVREPLHARSVGRWRRYAAELAGVRARLQAAGIPLAGVADSPVASID